LGLQQHLALRPHYAAHIPGGSFTGDQFANFYLGLGNYNNQFETRLFYARSKEYAGYFQDNWRVTRG